MSDAVLVEGGEEMVEVEVGPTATIALAQAIVTFEEGSKAIKETKI